MPFILQFTPDAYRDIRNLRAADRAILRVALGELARDPLKEGRLQKRLRDDWPSEAPTRPTRQRRAGDLRIFYDVDQERITVLVLRVVRKREGRTTQEVLG